MRHFRIPVLLLASLFYLTAFADDTSFGVSEASNQNKINALLQNVQAQSSPQAVAAPPPMQASNNTADSNSAATQNPAPAANATDTNQMSDAAFANMVRNIMPLTPQQIKTLHYMFDRSQNAAAQYPGVPPKPTSTSLIVNLAPGATPPSIRLRKGFVTSLVFVDATGSAWPIQAYDLGDQKSFNVVWDQKSNTLLVQALDQYNTGNLAVMLKGLDTPIMITLMSGQAATDYRVDMRIPKLGPNANPQAVQGLPATENASLLNVLNGIPPQNGQALVVKGADVQAWLVGHKIFLRTDMSILSPAFISTLSSADGTHAYEIQASPVILALQRGKIIKLMIEGL